MILDYCSVKNEILKGLMYLSIFTIKITKETNNVLIFSMKTSYDLGYGKVSRSFIFTKINCEKYIELMFNVLIDFEKNMPTETCVI